MSKREKRLLWCIPLVANVLSFVAGLFLALWLPDVF